MSDLLDTDTPGRVLATARVRAGLTVADVAARSRVPLAALEAIDADDHSAIGAPIYVRGFVKLYAREVGVDPAAVLRLLERARSESLIGDAPEPEPAPAPPRTRRGSRAIYSVAGAALIAALLLVVLFSVTQSPSPTPASVPAPESTEVVEPTVVPLPAEVIEQTTPD